MVDNWNGLRLGGVEESILGKHKDLKIDWGPLESRVNRMKKSFVKES
jgi:hypothetical protein